MDDLSRIESRIRDLERSLAGFERRLNDLERERAVAAAAPPADLDVGPPPVTVAPEQFGATITFVGRTFVALGGAYLLRALTDSAVVPQRVGIALGMGYAFLWLGAADRAGARGRRLSASFHALVASLIAFPLLWEATVRFHNLSPTGSAIALSVVTAAAFGVAVRRNLQPVAWIVTCAALTTAIAAISMTGALATFALYLIALGLLTLWIGYAWDWVWLRWPAAFVADLTVFALTLSGAAVQSPQPPAVVIAVQMLLLNGYLASIVVRTIVRSRDVIGFEVIQTLAALGVGFGGAVFIAERTGAGAGLLALINLAFAVGCYLVAFVFMRQGRPRNFYFYSSLAIVLVVASSTLLLTPPMLAVVAVALAIAASWTGGRIANMTLTVHGAVYLLIAGIASGLLAAAAFALVAPVGASWPPFSAAAIATLFGYAVCWLVSPAAPAELPYIRAPRAFVAVLLVWGGTGACIVFLMSLLSRLTGVPPDAGVVATIRSATLAAAAVALAWVGQRDRFRESAWLLYPVLAAGGVKLLIEDLQLSRPATLFVALAAYGLALIAAPRLTHHHTA